MNTTPKITNILKAARKLLYSDSTIAISVNAESIVRNNIPRKVERPSIVLSCQQSAEHNTLESAEYMLDIRVYVNDSHSNAMDLTDVLVNRCKELLSKQPLQMNSQFPADNLRCRFVNTLGILGVHDDMLQANVGTLNLRLICDDQEITNCT